MMQRIITVSDLHLAVPGPLNNFHAGPKLATFFAAQARSGTTLVLAGDVFDLLQTPGYPAVLDLHRAPNLVERTFEAIAREPWGRALFDALASVLDMGGELVVMPGNHDPELAHPATRSLLLKQLGFHDHPGLHVHATREPWRASVGNWQVVIGHGHRADAWNAIEPEALLGALSRGESSLPLPPGSRLVTDVLNVFKEVRDPSTGNPRFPFIDLLKPETPAVPLLLLYLDRQLALRCLPSALGLSAERFVRSVKQWLADGPVLAEGPRAAVSSDPCDDLARSFVTGFDAAERSNPGTSARRLEAWLTSDGGEVAGADMLAQHGGIDRVVLRAFLIAASGRGSFFDPRTPSPEDQAIIDEHLSSVSGPTAVIAGHTHAAREIVLSDHRVYINTGTWTDLMRFPTADDETALRTWIDELDAGRVPRFRKLTYAEVTSQGPVLREYE